MEEPQRITKVLYFILSSVALLEGGEGYCLNESRRGYRGATILTTIILSTIYEYLQSTNKNNTKHAIVDLVLQQLSSSEQGIVVYNTSRIP